MSENDERQAAYRNRVVDEILGDVEFFEATEGGPDGPWMYRSLKVRRMMNHVVIFDVDGRHAEKFHISVVAESDDPNAELHDRLTEIHERTLSEM